MMFVENKLIVVLHWMVQRMGAMVRSGAFSKPSKRNSGDNLDFLPAALEILERPPSPIGRWLGFAIIALFVIILCWALIGRVDVVASAEGKIIPGDRVKDIQPLQMSVVKRILVEEGQDVVKGQALIELDQSLTGADLQRLTQELAYLKSNLARELNLKHLLSLEEQGVEVTPQRLSQSTGQYLEKTTSAKDSSAVQSYQAEMVNQKWYEYTGMLAIAQSQIQNRLAELEAISANIAKYSETIPLITKRVDAMATLNKDGLIAEARLLELQEEQINQQQNLQVELARKVQTESAIAEMQYTMAAQRNQARKANLEAIENIQQQVDAKTQELAKAGELNAKQVLYSPVDGKVKELGIHTVGGVVREAQTLMKIVPKERFLEVEATLPNKDIGFVHLGQRAEIKVHTFPFTKYGVVDAEVLGITADAIESETQGLVYKVRLKMATNQLWVDSRWVELLPGMAVSAEMKTGERRLIEFFLSPLLRYKSESVRER